jgi:hypothetical protein
MRLQELTENLEWPNKGDKEIFMSLKGLVNKNNGVWKSQKQRWFIMNKKIGEADRDRSAADNENFFGIRVKDGQILATVDAMARWADYGARSQVPVRYGFIVDEHGVIEYYKIGNKGNMRDGASPDPSKTKKVWTRPDKINVEHLIPDPEEERKRKKQKFMGKLGLGSGKHIGEVGERVDFGEVTLDFSKHLKTYQVAYNAYNEVYWNVYKDLEGNVIYHNGKETHMEQGEKANMVARVKDHIVNKKGEKVTTVKIPKFK